MLKTSVKKDKLLFISARNKVTNTTQTTSRTRILVTDQADCRYCIRNKFWFSNLCLLVLVFEKNCLDFLGKPRLCPSMG